MSSEFNIIQNIYKLARLAQLKEDHYKRIDDVKFRRRSNAIAIVEIETRATISRIISITRSRLQSMKKQNRRSSKQRYETLINFVHRIFENSTQAQTSKRLTSIRLKNNLWRRTNASIAMNQIISAEIARNSENSELSRWTWKRRQKTREKNNLR
jgi:hypothetical protein